MKTYTTIYGDTWDSMSYDFYGDEKYMRLLIEANRPYIETLMFRAGIVINVPDLPDVLPENTPFWRK